MQTSKFLGLILLIMTTVQCTETREPLVIGHRGAMGHETENSLASVKKALELGVDMLEIDVFKIKSNEIVVFHDRTVDRLTNGGGAVEDYFIYDLKKLELKGGHRIPQLQEVLQAVDKKARINVELKGAGTADRVNHILDYYVTKKGWSWNDFVISSFDWDELAKFRELNPDAPIAVLTVEDPLKALGVAEQLDALAINPNYKTLTPENVNRMQEEGYAVYTWTVNAPEDIARMKEYGVDGIISDYPERVKE